MFAVSGTRKGTGPRYRHRNRPRKELAARQETAGIQLLFNYNILEKMIELNTKKIDNPTGPATPESHMPSHTHGKRPIFGNSAPHPESQDGS
jgi:hypothetical protein